MKVYLYVYLRVVHSLYKLWVLCAVFLMLSSNGLAQIDNGNAIDQNLVGKSLKTVLKFMKSEFDMEFAYDVALLSNKKCLEQYSYVDAEDLLWKVISPYDLNFRKSGSIYLILPVKEWQKTMEAGKISRTNFTLSGRVVDEKSGEPLPYAFLNIKNSRIWTESNEEGYFQLSNIPNDTMLLSVNYLGHNLFLERLNQLDSENLVIKLKLYGSSLSPVDIITNKHQVIEMNRHVSYHKIDPGQIDLISGNGQPDVFKGLQLVSGVQTDDASSAALSIRNSEEGENLVLIDGIPLYHLSHFFGIYSTVNPDVMKSIRLYKSTFGAEFGGKVGGVLDMNVKEGNENKVNVSVNANLISGGILIEAPIIKQRTTLMLGARKSYTDVFRSSLYRNLLNINYRKGLYGKDFLVDEVVDADASLSFYDVNLKVKHRLNDKVNISFIYMGAEDDYQNQLIRQLEGVSPGQSFKKKSSDESGWGSVVYGVSMSKQWSEKHHSLWRLNRSSFYSNYRFDDTLQEFLFDNLIKNSDVLGSTQNKLVEINASIEDQWQLESGHHLKIGMEWRAYAQDNTTQKEFSESTLLNRSERLVDRDNIPALFIVDKYDISDRLQGTGGLRMEVYDQGKKMYVLPRVKLRMDFTDNWSASIAVGRYHQYVRKVAQESIAINQSDTWVMAGDQVPIVRSDQATLAVNYQKNSWEFSWEGYWKNNTGTLINRRQDSLFSPNTALSGPFLIGDTKIMGMDWTLVKNFRHHSAWLAYSRSQALNYFQEINNGQAFSSKNNRLHDFKLNYQYRVQGWALASSFVFASGKRYTPVIGTFTNDLNGAQYVVYGDDYSGQLPDYIRMDIGVKYNIKWRDNVLKLGLGVYNVLNRKNINQRTYYVYRVGAEIDAPVQIDMLDLEVLGISPNFSISYRIL